MKKHIILIMNIVLIVLIIGGGAFTVYRAIHMANSEPAEATAAPTEPDASPDEAPTEGPLFRIGIIQHGLGTDSDSCYAGFVNQMNKRKVLDSLEIVYVVENNDEKCKEAIRRLVDEGCDLLYTIGPFASKYTAEATTEIPIVFAAVTDPEEMGLVVSNEAPGGNITGVSSYTPCFEQIDLIPVLLQKCTSVAAIYTATDVNAVRQALIACWEAEDFEYSADRYPVSDAAGIAKALDTIKEKGTDVIYLPIDRMIGQNIDEIVNFSVENGVPIICGNRAMMMSGCLATCEINYTSIGRKSADLTCDILFGKKEPSALPVIYKYDCNNIVNEQALERLQIELSDVAKANVTIVDCEE